MAENTHALCRKLGKVGTLEGYTHQVYYGPETRYEINKQNLGELFVDYCRDLDEGIEGLNLGERPRDIMPVIMNLKMGFDTATFSEPFDEKFVTAFAHTIQQVIVQSLNVKDGGKELICIVLESDPFDSKDGKTTTIEMRFQFPYCRCDVDVQNRTLKTQLIKRLRSINMMSKFFLQPIGDWDKIIESDFHTRPIPMYGSKSNKDSHTLTLFKIFKPLNEDDIDNDDAEIEHELADIFNPGSHSYVERKIIDKSIFRVSMDARYWLPVFLSIDYDVAEVLPRRQTKNSPGTTFATNPKYDLSNFGRGGDLEEISKMDVAIIFLKMWTSERILTREYWMTIGEALYDADDGNDVGLRTWIDITERAMLESNKVPEFLKFGARTLCETYYFTFRLDRTTIKTLAWYAREDNKRDYETWHREWCRKAMEMATSGLDTDVGRAFYRIYWLNAMCTYHGKKIIWYVFDKHRLKENPNGYMMSRLMSGDFYKRFLVMMGEIIEQMKNTTDDKEQANGQIILTGIASLLKTLKTHNRKRTFMAEAAECFVHDDLDSLLDDNPEILGLPNGVSVATTERINIRKGRPEDYVTRSVNVPYRQDFTWDHPMVREVTLWMRQTFPDEELCNQYKKILASLLRGGNNDKKFFVFTGKGDNSKSMWTKALECVLGPYCIKFPVSMVTGSRGDGNGPSPAMARSKATRLCVLEEPESDTPMKAAIINYLTGSDSFFARMMKKNGGDIKPLFKLFLLCNNIPAIPNGGKAIMNRMSVNPCMGTWSDDAPETEEEQFKANDGKGVFPLDPFFDAKIPMMASALFWVMVQCYPLYLKEGVRKAPEIVKKVTQEYWESNDVYLQFTAERLEPAIVNGVQDKTVTMGIDVIYEEFKAWHKGSFPSMRKIPDRPVVKAELINRWGMPSRGCWAGIRLKQATVNINALGNQKNNHLLMI